MIKEKNQNTFIICTISLCAIQWLVGIVELSSGCREGKTGNRCETIELLYLCSENDDLRS